MWREDFPGEDNLYFNNVGSGFGGGVYQLNGPAEAAVMGGTDFSYCVGGGDDGGMRYGGGVKECEGGGWHHCGRGMVLKPQ